MLSVRVSVDLEVFLKVFPKAITSLNEFVDDEEKRDIAVICGFHEEV